MYHQLIIAGHVGRKKDLFVSDKGIPSITISVAANLWKKNADGEYKTIIWFNVMAYGNLAEFINKYVNVGDLVMATGKLTPDLNTGNPRAYITKDGKPGATYDVVVGNLQIIKHKDGSTASNHSVEAFNKNEFDF